MTSSGNNLNVKYPKSVKDIEKFTLDEKYIRALHLAFQTRVDYSLLGIAVRVSIRG